MDEHRIIIFFSDGVECNLGFLPAKHDKTMKTSLVCLSLQSCFTIRCSCQLKCCPRLNPTLTVRDHNLTSKGIIRLMQSEI